MQMQIETRKAYPAEDRGAFVSGVLAGFLVLAAPVAADIVFAAESSPHQSPIAKAGPS